NNIETEEVLIARASTLHPETNFGENFQSRFRKGQTDVAAPSAPQPAAVQEKPAVAPAPAPKSAAAAAPTVAKVVPPPVVAAPKPSPVKKETAPKKTFPNELPIGFAEASQKYASGGTQLKGLTWLAVILLQPVIGALPHGIKKRLELAMQTPLFTAAGSTALNIVHNAVLYPLVAVAIAAAIYGSDIIFSQDINKFILLGLLLATVEGVIRLKDGIFKAKPAEEMVFLPSIYGAPLGIIIAPRLAKYTGIVREIPVPVEGFYSNGFVDKLERERRYGNVYTVEDRGNSFLVRMEFPRSMPDIGIANRDQLPDEMPDYDYDLALQDEQLIVKGKCTDEKVRRISSSVGAFPPE